MNRDLDPLAVTVLNRGLNVSHTTCLRSNLKQVIIGVEQAVQHPVTSRRGSTGDSHIIRHVCYNEKYVVKILVLAVLETWVTVR
jgi:hypothetical protein